MRRLAALALLVAAPAGADDEPAAPAPRVTSAHIDGTVARLAVQFDLGLVEPNDGGAPSLTLPHRAVVTSGTATVGGGVHRLQLIQADQASAAFDAILAAPPRAERTSAIVVNADSRTDSLTIGVIMPAQARIELALELEMPTCYFRDARYIALPPAARPGLAPDVARMVVTDPSAITEACAGTTGDEIWLEVGARDPSAPRIATVGQRLPLPAQDFAHVELDLAREISEVPRDLHTAIVIDGSRSLMAEEADLQRAVVEAYLRAVPQSHVQVIAYARDARALLPGWTNAFAAVPRVDRELRALELRNGSNLDAGLAAAGQWLERIEGTRRVIVLTDERTSDRLASLNAAGLAHGLPAGTLVHVAALEPSEGDMIRDDEGAFAPLAVATEGLAVRVRSGSHGVIDATMLTRPISLDKLSVSAPGWEPAGTHACSLTSDPSELDEGRSCEWTGVGTAAAGPITVTGVLWNKRVTRVVRPDPAGARTLARALSTDDGIASELQGDIARAAFALNSVWALYASWGGKGGYSDRENLGGIGMGSFGTCSCDGTGDIGHGFGTGSMTHLELRPQIVKAVAACHTGGSRIEIELETTREEIVDFDVHGATGALRDCIVEHVWDTFLTIPNAPGHAHTRVIL